MNFFNEDNFLHQFFLFLGKLIALNLLWMICSIPVITIGASTTAMYYCTLKLHKDKDIDAIKSFFKSFRRNFLQSTIIWVFLLVAAFILWLEHIAVKTMPSGARYLPMCLPLWESSCFCSLFISFPLWPLLTTRLKS